MITLTFEVNNQKLTRTDNEKIVNKTRNYIQLQFTSFSQEWTGLDTYLILKDEWGQNYLFDLNEEQPTVTVPEPVLRGGIFKVSLVGIGNEERITTNIRTIALKPSGYTTTHIRPVEPGDYSPDIFEQFLYEITVKVDVEIDEFIRLFKEDIQRA